MNEDKFNYEYDPNPLNSTRSSEGHPVDPPQMPMYSNSPQGSDLGLQGDEILMSFHKSRKTAKKCGKVIMYLGYFLMVGNLFGLVIEAGQMIQIATGNRPSG